MKQALIVDPHGTVEDFASSALTLYELYTVGSLQEAIAMASGAEYDLFLIARHDGLCDGALWTMVERIARLASEDALIMVRTEDADEAFHARAADLGVTVLTAPLDVAARALIDEVTAS